MRVLQSKSIIELDALLAKVNLAASNFRSLFPSDDEPETQLRHRNSEPHSGFFDLQAELLISTISQGRMFALSFYYGQIISTINGIIASRNAFKVFPEDDQKIAAYIAYRGQHSLEVENWKKADNQNVLMSKDLREFRDAYFRAFEASKLPKSSKPEWMSETLFQILHSLSFPCRSRMYMIDFPLTWMYMIDFNPRPKKSLFVIITTSTCTLLLIFTGQHVPSIPKSDMAGLQATTSPMVVGHVPAHR